MGSWHNAVLPKIAQVIAFAKSRGAQRFGMVGFAGAGCCEDFGADRRCGMRRHSAPICAVEAALHHGDNVAMAKAHKPRCPATRRQGSTDHDKGGTIFRHLRPGSATHRYPTMPHGWMTRGDAKNDEAAARCKAAGSNRSLPGPAPASGGAASAGSFTAAMSSASQQAMTCFKFTAAASKHSRPRRVAFRKLGSRWDAGPGRAHDNRAREWTDGAATVRPD